MIPDYLCIGIGIPVSRTIRGLCNLREPSFKALVNSPVLPRPPGWGCVAAGGGVQHRGPRQLQQRHHQHPAAHCNEKVITSYLVVAFLSVVCQN